MKPFVDHLDLQIIQMLLEEAKSLGERADVTVHLTEIFSNPDYLSSSFQQVI